MDSKSSLFFSVIFFFCFLALYLYRIDTPGIQVWDEQYHIPAAQTYRTEQKSTYKNLRNPPLGKELIAVSIWIFGENFRAYRLPSALAAAGVGALLFFASFSLTGNWLAGLLSLSFWITSTLVLLHARLAMLDMMSTFFFCAGLVAFIPILFKPKENQQVYLSIACLLAAMGGAVKVIDYTLFPLFLLGLFLIRDSWPLRKSFFKLVWMGSLSIFGVLIVSYGALGFSPLEIPRQFLTIYKLQSHLHRDYSGLSPWYDWFLLKGQLWYRSELGEDGKRFAALCIQNPILWICGTFSCFVLLLRGTSSKNAPGFFLAAAIPLQILFWVAFKRQSILTYGLLMEPVFCLTIPWLLHLWTKKYKFQWVSYLLWGSSLSLLSGFYFLRSYSEVRGHFF